ncbi:hypothetical protein IL992_23625 [Microbispora sp. NEAU-D428]|uniref:hypothetical protein n=1 Tax=Microbispora sitophila TaxID=2771537 RepID=UPI0018687073|nr:hypothetical protein [Microbispora sitophila]MBE3012163.1 hypothetical protein [Microbispora sitophila]
MQSLHVRRLLLVIPLVIMVGPLTAGSTATLPPRRSVTAIAMLVGDYLATHPTVKRVLRSSEVSVTLISCGAGTGSPTDLSADLGDGFSGRLIRTRDATYFQMPIGSEVAPGKSFDKVTDYYEPYNLLGIGTLAMMGTNLINSHRAHALLIKTGRLTAATIESGTGHHTIHYTVHIDVRRAVERLNLPAYIGYTNPMPLDRRTEEEYAKVRAGDPAAQARLRARIAGDLGPSADYELWVDLSGRPVRYVLSAKTRTEMSFSDWETCVVKAPPSERVRELKG